jgi:predicted transcriptional regulator of viral defense system
MQANLKLVLSFKSGHTYYITWADYTFHHDYLPLHTIVKPSPAHLSSPLVHCNITEQTHLFMLLVVPKENKKEPSYILNYYSS